MLGRLSLMLRQHPIVILISLSIIVLSLLLFWAAQGAGKNLWDLMELLIIPVVLAVGAFLLNRTMRERDLAIESDRQRQAILSTYFDRMTDLILKDGLRVSEKGSAVRSVARARTLSALRNLDGQRKGYVVRFLHESGLLAKSKTIVDLAEADLRGVDLKGVRLQDINLDRANLLDADLQKISVNVAKLSRANLQGANLERALLLKVLLHATNLQGANLERANLTGNNLTWANLQGANLVMVDFNGSKLNGAYLQGSNLSKSNLTDAELRGANLESANLEGANVSPTQLSDVKSLDNATMPDGTKYEDWRAGGEKAWKYIPTDLEPALWDKFLEGEPGKPI